MPSFDCNKMNWIDLHTRLAGAGLLTNPATPAPEVIVTGVCQDSRKVQPGYVFTAIQGMQENGKFYIQHALDAGAGVILSEEALNGIFSLVQVSNARKASAVIASAFYKDPAASLQLTGVTGTNGKTTTGTLVHHVLESTGTATGLIGTITCTTGKAQYISRLTTPDATELHPMLAEMVDSGCKACVIEVSSHALDQYRTATLNFSVGIFTNLMHDHLDYHKTMEHYLESKKRLFDGLEPQAVAVYNQDDQAGKCMVRHTRAAHCSFGQHTDADIRFSIVEDRPGGLRLRLDGRTSMFRLAGTFNAYNLAAAYGAARATGLPGADVIDALSEARPISGRFEQYICNDRTRIIIDYAHTPDALEQVLQSLTHSSRGAARLWCIFGCGGNRDQAKRPIMGAIAENLADEVIITSDNPRNEPARAIANAILSGMEDPERAHLIPSRSEAVQHVAETCNAGDIVLLAGKGHESVQVKNETWMIMKDQDLILKAFASLNPKLLQ